MSRSLSMRSSMSMRSRRDLPPPQQTIEKLENMVAEGNYYEAQQMYKSTGARYIAAQKYLEALDILQSGALVQLKHGQVLSKLNFIDLSKKKIFATFDGKVTPLPKEKRRESQPKAHCSLRNDLLQPANGP
ncbi:Os01g0164700 [Oryza sativa Japonica Group]|uniref:Os01g0164700 protein n=2 Tax=Oryza sativa subsp. japonica TaxID=39947 RepID=C7IWM8_ORYSJ|nr:hypothetical protein EE612_000425 [Oryza sativa]BAH90923.1 Os01g0164700 [Oryza sativa Japonica Group]BAS70558.1 Os01g0164700 [Oryza sativa Japonica Group]|eukprot:NP_001172193.1 Os01g0164700 [Oryza sativa Japonica Group]